MIGWSSRFLRDRGADDDQRQHDSRAQCYDESVTRDTVLWVDFAQRTMKGHAFVSRKCPHLPAGSRDLVDGSECELKGYQANQDNRCCFRSRGLLNDCNPRLAGRCTQDLVQVRSNG